MAKALPTTMRTIQHNFSKRTLTLTSTPLPQPNFTNNEHLIKILTVAPCAGELSWPRPPELNISVPGVDAVGTVVSSPSNSPFQPGRRVYYRTTYPNPGSLREYSLALTSELASAPRKLSAVDAAAIPVSALTAYQALFTQLGVSPPSSTPSIPTSTTTAPRPRILINGATGSVGLWVLQLSLAANLTTLATASPRNQSLVSQLGAHEILDYTSTSPSEYVSTDPERKVDFVFDAVGRKSLRTLWPALKPQGKLISIVPSEDMDFANYVPSPPEEMVAKGEVAEGVKGEFFVMTSNGEQLGKITELVEQGRCKGVVDSVFGLEDFEKVFERVDGGRAVGKVVVKVADEEEEEVESK